MYYFIECIRALATAMVANSHYKGVYPVEFMSFGGGMGVTLFFMISGFLLANVKYEVHFTKWYIAKAIRLYIPFLVYTIIIMAYRWAYTFIQSTIYEMLESEKQKFIYRIFPLSHWFICAILILYVFYFVFVKYIYQKFGTVSLKYIVRMLSIVFLIWYCFADKSVECVQNPDLIMYIIWFLCMLIGFAIKENQIRPMDFNGLIYILVTIISLGIYFTGKILIARNILMELQILLPISYVLFAYSVFAIFMNREEFCEKVVKSKMGGLIEIISKSSLEIYLVTQTIVGAFNTIMFPFNFVVITVIAIICGCLLQRVSKKITGKIMGRIMH